MKLRPISIISLFLLLLFALSGCGSQGGGGASFPRTGYKENRNEHTVGITRTFSLAQGRSTQAILKKIVADVPTKYGTESLKVWVSKDSFGDASPKKYHITQNMVDKLANAFLKKDGNTDDDIYDFDTTIYGREWGSDAREKYGELIGDNHAINILLTDIDDDNNPKGGAIGYFYPRDNFTRDAIPSSNERIMFCIDSVMFANGDKGKPGWNIHDPMPSETLSTLAHEFQHMIHFYQKTIMLTNDGSKSDTWIDEMMAETTEDIVATKIGIPGPRHVAATDGSAGDSNNTRGRYPLFNQCGIHLSMTHWGDHWGTHACQNRPDNYSKVSSFGAFLIRNYGGAELLHNMMHNEYTDKEAVTEAITQTTGSFRTLDELLTEWGEAVLLSDKTQLPEGVPHYNTGDFQVTSFNGSDYKMGSINFFNYTPQPNIQTREPQQIEPLANYYYLVGKDINGTQELNVTLGQWTEMALVIKNHSGEGNTTGTETNYTYTDDTIEVKAGDRPSAQALSLGGNKELKLDLGSSHRDVYLLLTNTNSESDRSTTIDNPLEASNRRQKVLSVPALHAKRVSSVPKSSIAQEIETFKHSIPALLAHSKATKKETK